MLKTMGECINICQDLREVFTVHLWFIPSPSRVLTNFNAFTLGLYHPQVMFRRDSRLRKILGTSLSWFGVIGFLSTGHVGCLVSHS